MINCEVADGVDLGFIGAAKEFYQTGSTEKSLFNDPYFWETCISVFGEHNRIKNFRFLNDQQVCGFAIFREQAVSLMGQLVKCWVPITYQASDFTHIIAQQGLEAAIWESLLTKLGDLQNAVLVSHLRPKDILLLPKSWQRKNFFSLQQAPFCLNVNDAFEKICKKKSLKRHTNRYKRTGEFKVEHLVASENDTELNEFFELHKERWRFDRIESKFNRQEMRTLYQRLVSYHQFGDPTHQVVYTKLQLDKRTIAAHIGYRWQETFLYHIPVMNLAELAHSPGEVLMSELFKYAIATRCDNLHLGYGGEAYKARFSNNVEELRTYLISRTLRQRVSRGLRVIKGSIAPSAISLTKSFAGKVKSLLRLLKRMVRPLEVCAYLTSSRPEPIENSLPVRKLSFADYVEFQRGLENPPYELDERLYNRFKQGYELFGLVFDEEIVSFAWVRSHESQHIGEAETTMTTSRAVVWIVDCVTPKKHRRNGYYRKLLQAIIGQHPDSTCCIYASRSNTPSIKGIESAGFEHWGTICSGLRTSWKEDSRFELTNTLG